MALLSTTITHPSLFFKIPNPNKPLSSSLSFTNPKIHFPRFLSPSLHVTHSSLSDPNPNPRISDEWGEPSEPEPEPESPPDPPMSEDEWGVDDGSASAPVTVSGSTKEEEEEEYVTIGNGSTPSTAKDKADVAGEGDRVNKLTELKRCLVDTFYGTELGFRAGPEVRAEISELVALLEAANPTPAPTDSTALLDGDWVLLYTAFSELLPLLAAGTTPLLKVKEIRQAIDTSSLTILNSTTLSSPFATFSFSASATFEVRSSTRIQVAFKEGTFQPPEIKTSIDLPENVDVFGQRINLLPVQQSLSPLQDAVASISRVISGQPPLKVPIPGDRTSSWLLITYLDDDFRISRGDGGLFVLAKVGSTLLDQ
ncbi:plastoglobulin-1, chloroplastic [Fagus crenata]